MKINIHIRIVLLLFVAISCNNIKKSDPNTITEIANEQFEPVDVYLNPNTFEEHIGRIKPGDNPPGMNIEKWFNYS